MCKFHKKFAVPSRKVKHHIPKKTLHSNLIFFGAGWMLPTCITQTDTWIWVNIKFKKKKRKRTLISKLIIYHNEMKCLVNKQGETSYNFRALIINSSSLYPLLAFQLSLHDFVHQFLLLVQCSFLHKFPSSNEAFKRTVFQSYLVGIKWKPHQTLHFFSYVCKVYLIKTLSLNLYPIQWFVSEIETFPPIKLI